MNHNVVVATTCDDEAIDRMRQWIADLCVLVDDDEGLNDPRKLFTWTGSWVNCYQTVILSPDGGGEYRPQSRCGNDLREKFVARLREDDFPDGTSPWDWVEVGFGEFGQKVLRGNCVNCYSDKEYEDSM